VALALALAGEGVMALEDFGARALLDFGPAAAVVGVVGVVNAGAGVGALGKDFRGRCGGAVLDFCPAAALLAFAALLDFARTNVNVDGWRWGSARSGRRAFIVAVVTL
jgi:hypothetical protein